MELVVGDDGSTDDPGRLATQTTGWRVIPGPPTNSYAARTCRRLLSRRCAGILRRRLLPEPDWLERGLEALEDADQVAGRIRFDVPEHYTVWTLIDMEWAKNHEAEVKQGVADGQPLSPT